MAAGRHYTGTIDAKGRLILPPRLKLLILRHNWGRDLFVTSTTGEAVHIYPLPLWEDLEKQLSALAATNPLPKKFLQRTALWGQSRRMDTRGRIPIPPNLRESAALKGRVELLASPRFAITVLNRGRLKELRSSPLFGRHLFETNPADIVERLRGGLAHGGSR